jgi:integrase
LRKVSIVFSFSGVDSFLISYFCNLRCLYLFIGWRRTCWSNRHPVILVGLRVSRTSTVDTVEPFDGRDGLFNARRVFCAHVHCQILDHRAGIGHARIHDLRHSYASVGVASGVGLYLTGKILGHARNTTTERYAHLADDPVRQANDVVGRRIKDAMNTPPKRIGLGTTP